MHSTTTRWMAMRPTLTVLALGLLSACASDTAGVRSAIAGGAPPPECGWPTAAEVRSPGSLCSGVLIHPRVVLYAAHCGDAVNRITFGPSGSTGTPYTPTRCFVHPDFDPEARFDWLDYDFAVCELPTDVDLPIVPLIMGCEEEELVRGMPMQIVGFGRTPSGSLGIKHAVDGIYNGMLFGGHRAISGLGADPSTQGICGGDSGGPDYFQLADGTWRVLGVHSMQGGTACDGGSHRTTFAPLAVPWIETVLPYDVTPCHDVDGTWNPGPDCGRFPTDPAATGGAWGACEPAGIAEVASATCAPAAMDAGPSPIDGGSVDGGSSDGGPVDGGSADGSSGPSDGGSRTDAGFTDLDGGVGPVREGCSCRASGSSGSSRDSRLALGLMIFAWIVRRRRSPAR